VRRVKSLNVTGFLDIPGEGKEEEEKRNNSEK